MVAIPDQGIELTDLRIRFVLLAYSLRSVLVVAEFGVGLLAGMGHTVPLPWRSDDLAERIGVEMADDDGNPLFERHTALGDAKWVQAWWKSIMRNTPEGSK